MSGRSKIKKYQFLIIIGVKFIALFPKSINMFLLSRFRNIKGNLGLFLRYLLIKNLMRECGENVSIQPGVFLLNIQGMSFGSNISIHPMCYLDGLGGLTIKDNVSIAHGSSILTTNHTWSNREIPIKYNPVIKKSVTIENDVWIGCGCRVLAGVNIQSRSIIAAGAVVLRNVDSEVIVGGVPAKIIKTIRSSD